MEKQGPWTANGTMMLIARMQRDANGNSDMGYRKAKERNEFGERNRKLTEAGNTRILRYELPGGHAVSG